MASSPNLFDTIAAIATAIGDSGIGIVRISGKGALSVADKVFVSKDKKKPSTFKAYSTHYGWIVKESKVIDEVILTLMRSPRSYTKEDVVEINCHGGIVALRAILELVLENGCRLADPGEFTRRAFLNGRIDLAQAEAVLDIIRAKTGPALKLGVEQLGGALSREIGKIRQELLEILSIIEANIDFPEEEIGALDLAALAGKSEAVSKKLNDILRSSERGRVLREGIGVVICGKPNVGKSSLLNALLKKERSIVTPIPGTTRDTIEEVIDIRGIPVRIVDTAGILEPRDLIEKEAVLRSRRQIDLADLVILMFDGSRGLDAEDKFMMRKIKRKTAIAIINKIDLPQRAQKGEIAESFPRLVNLSAKKNKNVDLLEDTIADLIYKGGIHDKESILVSNLRHIVAIREAQKLIAEAGQSLDNKLSLEFVSQYIRDALGFLDNILGKDSSGDLLDKIFSQFCIGK